MTSKKWIVLAGIVLGLAVLFVGLKYKGEVTNLVGGGSGAGSGEGAASGQAGGEGDEKAKRQQADLQKQQEEIARSIAEQQSVAQQAQQQSMDSVQEVQRTLKTIEEINRVNRTNQQMQQQMRNQR